MNLQEIKRRLIDNGYKSLKEFGYPSVNKNNILSDSIYSQFFESLLTDSMGQSAIIDIVINEILVEIKNNKNQ